ncbi:hypothetical protein COOONC_03580 [Cooperia oncophora]
MDNFTTLLPTLADSLWLAPALCNSSLAVDSFLFVSGAVVAFNYRKRILFRGEEKEDTISHIVYRQFMFYFHRVCRLWPAVLVTSMFMLFMFNHLGDGPLWSSKGTLYFVEERRFDFMHYTGHSTFRESSDNSPYCLHTNS